MGEEEQYWFWNCPSAKSGWWSSKFLQKKKKKALRIIEKWEILSSKASEKQEELCKLLQLSTNRAFCVVLTVTLKSLTDTDGVS